MIADREELKEFLAWYNPYLREKKRIEELTKNFNPDTDIIIPKEKLDLTERLATQINELHRVQFAGCRVEDTTELSPAEKRKIKKREKEERIQQLRNRAHHKILSK